MDQDTPPQEPSHVGEGRLRLAAGVLALAGIGIATYVAIAEAGGGSPVCLAGGHGCETVSKSEYSELAGINVAVVGIAGYALLAAALLIPADAGRFATFTLALAGFGFSIYLTYLELFVIDALCQWCMASAALMTVIFALSVTRLLRFAGSELSPPPQHPD